MKRTDKTYIPFILFCTVIPIANFLLFYIYPNLSAFTMAFTNKDGIVSLDNFQRFIHDLSVPSSDIRIAFVNTFITFGIVLISFPFKVLVSYFILQLNDSLKLS